ncbi:MAG: domain S-box protein [Segetibacter sp.]|nr:domain S-box protein [Segetibacter sp.]
MGTNNFMASPLSQVEAGDSDDYYRQLIENIPAAVYTCDIDGYIKFYNRAAANMWGREPEIGKDLWCGSWKLYNPDGTDLSLDKCPMAVTLIEKRAVLGEEIIVERPDGECRHVLPHPQPIYNAAGKMIGAMNMLVDVTENKRMLEANRMLNFYNEQLEQFAYAASHDLQEPLRKINTYASFLSEKNHEALDKNSQRNLAKISESAQRMTSLISDLLNFTRQTKIEDQFVKTDLNKIIENIKSDLELMIAEKQAQINYHLLPAIKAVPSQMNRLFYNLINNSLKFSKEDTPPVVTITALKSSSFIEIFVTDNGIGFDQVYAERIFNLFQRLNGKHSYSGNGIGLSLCKKFVECHKGEIFARSEENKGASFHIRLPASLLIE